MTKGGALKPIRQAILVPTHASLSESTCNYSVTAMAKGGTDDPKMAWFKEGQGRNEERRAEHLRLDAMLLFI